MSDVLFPLSLSARMDVEIRDRVLVDEFEDGSTNSRLLWTEKYFKRRFRLTSAPATIEEWKYLRSFLNQRGRWDSFFLRDNASRAGNAAVRITEPPRSRFEGSNRIFELVCDEIAPIRALPEFDEVEQEAANAPLFWWDANRELFWQHAGAQTIESRTFDSSGNDVRAAWQGAYTAAGIHGPAEQYQAYRGQGGSIYAKTPANLSGLSAGQPAASFFCFARSDTSSGKQLLIGTGAVSAGAALGIVINAANFFEPWIGGSDTWSGARLLNTDPEAWHSLAVVWPASSNVASFYADGALVGTATKTRSLTVGPAALLGAPDGSLIADSTVRVNHAMAFAAELDATDVAALHDLLAYQYGLDEA